MILGPVSLIDCAVFCCLLAWQLIVQAGFFQTLICGLRALPFLVLELPLGLIYDRVIARKCKRALSAQQAALFQDLVVRCVRYAFVHLPPHVGRVFLSREVALPFLCFRMLRKGFWQPDLREIIYQDGSKSVKMLFVEHNRTKTPDLALYFIHGGGFKMGSSYFYAEFLMAWYTLLVDEGYKNPVIFSLDYTLVPDAVYPTQVDEAMIGYKGVLDFIEDSSKVIIAGDSAGATLVLSLLLRLKKAPAGTPEGLPPPELAVLISPWVTLESPLHHNTRTDYLDAETLKEYAREYLSGAADQIASPGKCRDHDIWRLASPRRGFLISYSTEEVFVGDITEFIHFLKAADVTVHQHREVGGIHASAVALLFLCSSVQRQLSSLYQITKRMTEITEMDMSD